MKVPLEDLMAELVRIEPPKFDRAAVHDKRALAQFERRETPPFAETGSLPPALLGIPVFVDPDVEIGAIEFRLGNELFKRVYLGELRA